MIYYWIFPYSFRACLKAWEVLTPCRTAFLARPHAHVLIIPADYIFLNVLLIFKHGINPNLPYLITFLKLLDFFNNASIFTERCVTLIALSFLIFLTELSIQGETEVARCSQLYGP